MPCRRSKRLKGKVSPVYIYENTSSDDEEEEGGEEGEDSEEEEILPYDLVMLLHGALNDVLVEELKSRNQEKEVSSSTKKRKRSPDKDKDKDLPEPPLHPTDIETLIALCRLCQQTNYRDCENLGTLLEPLLELQQMIGLQSIKQSIVNFVLLHLQASSIQLPNMRHIIIVGQPGCGKTTIGNILAKIMSLLHGRSATPHVVHGTQASLIGSYLGQTAPKTEAVIRSAFGGVLLIDEASSLADGRSDQNSDSFSKSCIDTLNRMLSEHGDKFMCILAGYKEEIYRDILSINPGMDRRFATRFEIETYKAEELRQIILRHIQTRNVTIVAGEDSVLSLEWITKHMSCFKNGGGDCMLLVDHIMTSHATRLFGHLGKNVLTGLDLSTGMELFTQRHKQKTSGSVQECISLMYT
jgi:SpoVK/Ycf46/Vps4 family AAA+-type ATPase